MVFERDRTQEIDRILSPLQVLKNTDKDGDFLHICIYRREQII